MKKMNNKGFSLVELIIVIAIMAILAGAIAPALIRYIDQSRKSNDVSSCKTIKTAVETAMANEETYEALTNGSAGSKIFIAPGVSTSAGGGVYLVGATGSTTAQSDAKTEIGANIGEKTPKIKYKKNNCLSFMVEITGQGTVKVGLSKTAAASGATGTAMDYEISPEMHKEYQ